MSIKDYQYEGGKFTVTPQVKGDFNTKGYILVRNFLSEAEVKKIKGVLEEGDVMNKYKHELADGTDHTIKMCLWNHPGNDVTGMLARSEKMVNICEKLMEGEVYHFHTKVVTKEPKTGAGFQWHQDYGYWYKIHCLFPDLMTVFIAIDPCRQDNGGLQILEGSHRCGKIDHEDLPGGQMRVDPERLGYIKERCPQLQIDLQPGDALFFHCNMIHSSSRNESDKRRWAFLVSYNKASNDLAKKSISPGYTKLNKVPDSAILECKLNWDFDAKEFLLQDKRDDWFEEVTHHKE